MSNVSRACLCVALVLTAGCPAKTVVHTEAPDGELLYNRKPLRQWFLALEDTDPKVRGDALDVVELLADPKELGPQTEAVVAALAKALTDPDVALRKRAAHTLGKLGPEAKAAVPALIGALKDDQVCTAAIEALSQIGPGAKTAARPLLELLKHKDPMIQGTAAWALGDVAADMEEAVPALIEVLKSESNRYSAAYALGRLGPRAKAAIPDLLALLKSRTDDPIIRGGAAAALGAMGPEAKAAIPVLVQAVKEQEAGVQQHAALALVRLGEADVGPAALRGLLRQDSIWIMLELSTQLQHIGPESKAAVPVLIEALKDQSRHVRWFAAFMLGRIGPEAKGAVPALLAALRENDTEFNNALTGALQSVDPQAAAGAGYAAFEVVAHLVLYGAGRSSQDRAFRAVALSMPWVYGLDRTGSLYVFQVAADDKGKKRPASTVLEDVGDGNALAIFGDVLVCTRAGSLEVYSLQVPGRPRHLGRFGLDAGRYDSQTLIRHGNMAFLVGRDGILSYDLAEPAKPRFLARTECKGHPWAGCVAGKHLYVVGARLREGARYGIAVFEIAAPGTLKEVGFAPTARRPYHLFALPGNRLLASLEGSRSPDGVGNAAVFSVTKPAEPTLLSEMANAGGRGAAILTRDDQAYLVCDGVVLSAGARELKRCFSYEPEGATLDGFPYHGDSKGHYTALATDGVITVLRLVDK